MIDLKTLELSGLYTKKDIDNCNVIIQGIYFIFNKNDELMYIGKSNNIFNRMRSHYNGSNGEKNICHNYYSFRYGILNDPTDRDIYETWYINKMKPPLNAQKIFSYKSQKDRYANTLKEIDAEERIKEIVFKKIDDCFLLA